MIARASDRGLSEVIGFVIMFSVVIAAVGVVSTFGLGSLSELNRDEQLNSAERSFTILSESFEEIQQGTAPRRNGQISLNTGSITLRDQSDFRVTVDGPGGDDYETNVDVRSLEYAQGNAVLSYENGGTFRSERGNAGLQSPPKFACRDNVALVSFVRLNGSTTRKLGSGVVSVAAVRENSTLLYPRNRTGEYGPTAADTVVIDVTNSPSERAWEQYFESTGRWVAVDSDTFRCEDVETVIVRLTTIRVSFVR
jgi:flagellin-like protein